MATGRFGSPIGPTGFGYHDAPITVRLDAGQMIRQVLEVKSLFQKGLGPAAARVHEDAAMKIQQAMVDHLEKSINARGRPQGPRDGRWAHDGGALVEALKDERNRSVTGNQMVVGLPSWLERSPARYYYDRVEEGMGAYTAPGALFFNPGERGVGPWSKGGLSPNQFGELKSRSAPNGYPHLRMSQHNRRGVTVRVREFPGYHYSDGGRATFDRINFTVAYRTAFAAIGIPLSK